MRLECRGRVWFVWDRRLHLFWNIFSNTIYSPLETSKSVKVSFSWHTHSAFPPVLVFLNEPALGQLQLVSEYRVFDVRFAKGRLGLGCVRSVIFGLFRGNLWCHKRLLGAPRTPVGIMKWTSIILRVIILIIYFPATPYAFCGLVYCQCKLPIITFYCQCKLPIITFYCQCKLPIITF
jgi:hypothetical protein